MNKKYLDKSGLERVSGTINKKLTKNNNMPAASASLLGKFCLYTGENSATFRKGGVYECIHTSSGYKWELRSFNFIGTTSEWNALTLEEKVAYQTADILDDDNKTRYAVNQITGALIPISGGEVSWTGTLSEWDALSLGERAKYDGKKVFIIDDYMENIPVMIGASADDDGFKGLVPTPSAGDEGKFLKGDGLWENINILTKLASVTADGIKTYVELLSEFQNYIPNDMSIRCLFVITTNNTLQTFIEVAATPSRRTFTRFVPSSQGIDNYRIDIGSQTIYRDVEISNNGTINNQDFSNTVVTNGTILSLIKVL